MLPLNIALSLGTLWFLIHSVTHGPNWIAIVSAILLEIWSVIMLAGFFTLQPNEARVLILFGDYRGTARRSGFHWANPFYSNDRGASSGPRRKVSLRARTLNVEKLKVNDKRGNPIEIAAVVVWRVQDTAQAAFDVDDYEGYVHTQSETALRHLASAYATITARKMNPRCAAMWMRSRAP